MHECLQEVRYALRVLAKSPAFAAVAVLSLALGIGVNTAVLAVGRAVLLTPLPVPEPERLVVAYWWASSQSPPSCLSPSHPRRPLLQSGRNRRGPPARLDHPLCVLTEERPHDCQACWRCASA